MFLDDLQWLDLQWLDPASLDLLAHLLTTPDERALLVIGAFHSGRLAVLELLAAQAVISLESARLYADLQQENAERRRPRTRRAS
jgi:GAF domain-containing protein